MTRHVLPCGFRTTISFERYSSELGNVFTGLCDHHGFDVEWRRTGNPDTEEMIHEAIAVKEGPTYYDMRKDAEAFHDLLVSAGFESRYMNVVGVYGDCPEEIVIS